MIDSLKFIPTILAAVVTFFSILYSQRSAIHKTWFSPVVKLITILLISQLFISAYDLVKVMNLKDFQIGISLDKYANDFYFMIVLMAISYSLSPINGLISVSFQKPITYNYYYIPVILIMLITLWTYYKNIDIYNIKVYIIFILLIIIFLFIIAISMLYQLIFVFFQGHIKIKMNDIYYKKSSQIPVSIEITGVNDELLIKLRKSSVDKVIPIGNITLGPNLKDEDISGNNLIGNGFYSGIYYIFINTTIMTEGYYELVCSRSIDKYPYGKSFYLMNNE